MSIMSAYKRESPESYKFKIGDTAMFINDGESIAGGLVLDCQTLIKVTSNKKYCKLLFFKAPENGKSYVEHFNNPLYMSFARCEHKTGIFEEKKLIYCKFLLIEKSLKKIR